MKNHEAVMMIEDTLRMTRREIGEWCGVTEAAVTKWVARSSGVEHTGYGHEPNPEHAQKLNELLREARCVNELKIDPGLWRADAYVPETEAWRPVWDQFAKYICAKAKHYPHDDPQAAMNDLGIALLSDADPELNVTIRVASLSGEAVARCFENRNNWEVLVNENLADDRRREEALRELQAHVFHVKPNSNGLRVEQPLKGVEQIELRLPDSQDLGADELLTHRETNRRYRTWVLRRSNEFSDEKRALARYVAIHILRPQMLVQIASGTTENCLMDEIIANGIEDIQITTNNLQVLVKGLRASHFGISVNLTGGTLNPSIDSLIGPDAARVIADHRYMPNAVFFGAAGLSFKNGLCIAYAFEDEEATQVAYATRPTETRVLMADDSKLGRTSGRRAPVSLEQMMQTTDEFIVVSSYKPEAAEKIKNEVAALKALLEPLAKAPEYESKNFSLRFVDMKGSLYREYSLRGLREGDEWQNNIDRTCTGLHA